MGGRAISERRRRPSIADILFSHLSIIMTRNGSRIRVLATALLIALAPLALSAQAPLNVAPPDGRAQVTVGLDGGALRYAVRHAGANVVMPSRLGFAFKGADTLLGGLRI